MDLEACLPFGISLLVLQSRQRVFLPVPPLHPFQAAASTSTFLALPLPNLDSIKASRHQESLALLFFCSVLCCAVDYGEEMDKVESNYA